MKNYVEKLGFDETICSIGETIDALYQVSNIPKTILGEKVICMEEIRKHINEEIPDLTEREVYLTSLIMALMDIASSISKK